MIRIQIQKDKKSGQVLEVISKGHAGYAEEGSDIICSAVSVLLINTANSIEKFTSDDFQVDEGEDGGYLRIGFDSPLSMQADLLMNSLVLGLKSIEETYGKQYLSITETGR